MASKLNTLYYHRFWSAVGLLTVTSDGTHITGLWMEGQHYFPIQLPACNGSQLPVIMLLQQLLEDYFAGRKPDLNTIPLKPSGTPFQMLVWDFLRKIPYGATVTYGDLARSIGKPSAARAVGAAVGHNPISILIPCHRIIGASGQLTGYAGGIDRKHFLLNLESK